MPPQSPQPIEFPVNTPLLQLVNTLFDLSQNLKDNEPRCLMFANNRLQLNWQESGLSDGGELSIIDITLSARPSSPATIKVAAPHDMP